LLASVGVVSVTTGVTVFILGSIEGDIQKKNVDGTPMINASGGIIVERGPMIRGGTVAGPIVVGLGAIALISGIFLGRSGEMKYTLSAKPSAPSIGLSPAGVTLRF
jgi:hypothetical protein